MRVEFAPSGVGLGHAGRCIPIARGLQERDRNARVFFSTYLDAVSYIRREGFLTVEVPSMDFKVKPDGSVDFRRTAMSPGPFVAPFNFLGQVGKEIEVMETFEPDVVVSDSRASPLVAAYMLGIPSICILNQFQVIIPRKTHYLRLAKFADAMSLTILGRIWTTGSKVLIPDFPLPHTVCADNLCIPRAYRKKTRFIGPILSVRPETLPNKKDLREKLGLDSEKPLIFAPISGPLKERAYLMSMLQTIFTEFPDDYQIIMSQGYPKSHTPPMQHGNLRVFKWVPNRFEYLKACDIIVSRAGHGTVMQTICYGKPAILIPTPKHTEQQNNARRAVDLGVALTIEQESLNRGTLLSAVEALKESGRFVERAADLQREVSQLDGLKTAIAATIEVTERSRTDVFA
jgi:UDP-N-acetylglucosamine--N-acetylmuramyl-(pentapeptide) pyrophosphoryl-undecaprenol N-acetylglucosamine transferase